MRRMFLVAAALTIPAMMSVATGPAWAKTKPEKSISCKTFSGSDSGTVTIGGCKGNVGGGSQPLNALTLATGGTITWNNSDTTTIGAPSLSSVTNKKCKASGDTAEGVSATVTADTTGLLSLGTLTTQVCVDGSGNITALKPLKIT